MTLTSEGGNFQLSIRRLATNLQQGASRDASMPSATPSVAFADSKLPESCEKREVSEFLVNLRLRP